MQVSEVMTEDVLTITPGVTLRDAAKLMSEKKVGSVVVDDPEGQGVGILTERDILRAVAEDLDVDVATAADHLTSELVYAAPRWSLEEATEAMRRGGFRHLVVLDEGEVIGIISLRDVVKAWTPDVAGAAVSPG
jgi:CBS domain-containing protein